MSVMASHQPTTCLGFESGVVNAANGWSRLAFLRNRVITFLAVAMFAMALSPRMAFAQFDDLFGDSAGDSLSLGGASAKPEVSAQLKLLSGEANVRKAELSVTVVLPAGHYIYDVQGKFEGRTQIRTKLPEGVTAAGDFVSNKPPQKIFEPLFGVELFKLHDSATWTQKLDIGPNVDLKNLAISGGLEGQYCSAGEGGQCLPIIPAIKFNAKLDGDMPEATPAATKQNAKVLPFKVTERLKRGVKPQPIEFTAELVPENAMPGDKVNLVLTARIDPKYHTFSMTQPDGFGGSATVVEFDQLSGLTEAGPFSADHPHEIQPGDGGSLEVYHDRVTWTKPFVVNEGQAPGAYGLKAIVHSQACTQGSCVPMPKFKLALGMQEPSRAGVETLPQERGTPAGTGTTKAPVPPEESATSSEQPNALTAEVDNTDADSVVFWTDQDDENSNGMIDSGIVSFLVASFLGGWLALLTPCAFPMVPITVGFFLKQGHGKSLGLAIVYCLSIIAAFTLLGVGLSLVFGGPFLTQLANNSWMNVVIGAIFVAFGLSMLGLFELQPPSWLLTYTATQESAGGYLGVIFMALTFTLTSFTCTFPVAGSLLATASQGDVLWPILGMLAFSTAFALPFFFLALFPSMLRRLPKSGGWLFTLKVVLGFVEIGAAIKFFSVADQSMNPQPLLFDFAFVMVAWSVLAITAGLYLLGVFHLSHDQPQDRISPLQALSGTAFLGLSLFLMVGVLTPEKSGGALMPQILAFAPPQLKNGFKETDELGPVLVHDGIPFALDVNRALAVAKSRHQPLFLDFTGVNCVNCRLMEQKMKLPDNHSRLERFLGVQLFADRVPNITDAAYAERLKERNIFLQVKWFDELTLPLYAVMSPDGKTVLATYKGLELKEGEFAAFLDKGWKRFGLWQTKQVAAGEKTAEVSHENSVPPPSQRNKPAAKDSEELGPMRETFGLKFALDSDRAVRHANRQQQPILFNFTGFNDINSRFMEQKMGQEPNRSRMQRFVLTQLFVDNVPMISDENYAKHLLERSLDLQAQWFNDVTCPLSAIVSPDGQEILAVYKGLERKEGEFAAFLDKGWKHFEQWKAQQVAENESSKARRQ